MSFGNALRVASWRVRKTMNKLGILKKPVEYAPLQIRDELPYAKMPAAFFQNATESTLPNLQAVDREVRALSRLLPPLFPSSLSDANWHYLIECTTLKQRLDYLKFLRKLEIRDKKDALLAAEKKAKREIKAASRPAILTESPLSTIRLLESEKQRENWRLACAYMLRDDRPTLVVDCRFLRDLSPRGASLTTLQLQYLMAANSRLAHPWPLYFANWDASQARYRSMQSKYLAVAHSARHIGAAFTPHNYTDLFARESIVYLSPHAADELTQVDASAVYVLGGIVDRVSERNIHKHASAVAAELDGVRAMRLPLDRHVEWRSGTKFLTLLAVHAILNDVFENEDWAAALGRHIPVRNVRAAAQKNQFARQQHESIRLLDALIVQAAKRFI